MSTTLLGGTHDDVRVRIYPAAADDEDAEAAGCCSRRRAARFTAALSTTAVAVAVFCVATSTLVWSRHVGRRTPAATNLVNHYAVPDGL